jgi:hypothetical protein
MAAHQITIGPEFFAKAKNDYDNWHWAIIREFLQNSIDCGSDLIEITVQEFQGQTRLTVLNNGEPMTKDILVNKLLALGGSGKNFAGSVGGFGKAKEILYFCHENYVITSGQWTVMGSGAGYDLIEADEFANGTVSTIVIDEDCYEDLLEQINNFAAYGQWNGTLTVNGRTHKVKQHKGSPRKQMGFGTVYTNNSHPNTLIVRMNGIPMFFDYCSLDKCVVIELNGKSSDVLTSNRDGLNYPFRSQLSQFIVDLATNKRKALKQRNYTEYTRFEGAKLGHRTKCNIANMIVSEDDPLQVENRAIVPAIESEDNKTITAPRTSITAAEIAIDTEFIIKNDSGQKVPNYYNPGSYQFSSYSQKLVKYWTRIMLQLYRLFEKNGEFSIGFVFDDECEAQHENKDYGRVYYLNPCVRNFRKRFKLTERDRILSIAVHEFVHGLGYSGHDESYAGKLTDVFGVVMKNRKLFNWCFK